MSSKFHELANTKISALPPAARSSSPRYSAFATQRTPRFSPRLGAPAHGLIPMHSGAGRAALRARAHVSHRGRRRRPRRGPVARSITIGLLAPLSWARLLADAASASRGALTAERSSMLSCSISQHADSGPLTATAASPPALLSSDCSRSSLYRSRRWSLEARAKFRRMMRRRGFTKSARRRLMFRSYFRCCIAAARFRSAIYYRIRLMLLDRPSSLELRIVAECRDASARAARLLES